MQYAKDWAKILSERKILKDLVNRKREDGISKDDLPSYWSDDLKEQWIARWEDFKSKGELQWFRDNFGSLLMQYKNTPFLMSKSLNLMQYTPTSKV
jgi:hypothetical protein